jgi:hypothetical protein
MGGFQISTADLIKLHLLLNDIKNGPRTVTVRAINSTLAGVRTDAVDEVYKVLNLTKTRIRKDFKVTKANAAVPKGKVTASGKPVGLASFSGTSQRAKGTSVKVNRLGQRTIIKHAFLAEIKNANNVWRRILKPGGPKGKRVARLPIDRLTGPRIEDIIAKPAVMSTVMDKAGARFAANIDHVTEYLLLQHR